MKKRDFNWWWVISLALVITMVAFAVVLNINYSNPTTSNADGINIDNGDTKIDWDAYPSYHVELTSSYNITAPGTYYISGAIDNGGITIKLNDNGVARLVLNNVSIKNPSGPAIACFGGDDLVIEFDGSNYLEDGKAYTGLDEDVNGVIYSKADLTLRGMGSLGVVANYEDGIVSKDDLKIDGGDYSVVAYDDGIRGKDSVYIVDGDIEISSKGDGIKSTNDTDITKGFILVSGGSIDVLKSQEGLEARLIIVDNGDILIFANDDGINASESIALNGGNVYVNAAGDGVDSNGYIYINGGELVVDGPTNSGNGALDAETDIIMNGGTAVAVGSSGMAENLGENSTIYNMSIFFTHTLPAGTVVEIKNSADEVIISHTAAKNFSHMAAGSYKFKNDETYTIYIDGEEYEKMTLSQIVTTLGNGGMNGGPNTPGATPTGAPKGPGGAEGPGAGQRR